MNSDTFGELRSVLQRSPSTSTWNHLCELLDETAPRDELVAYLDDHLSRWPDMLREAPATWCVRALEGQTVPWWSTVRAVRLLQPTNATIKTFFKSVDVSQITSLTLENERPKRGSGRSKSGLVKELTKAGPLPNLKRVELRIGNFGVKSAELLAKAKNLTGLEALEFHSAQLEEEGFRALAGSKTLPPLKSLVVGYDSIDDRAQIALLESPLCAELERLHIEPGSGASVFAQLAGAPCASTLRELRLLTMGDNDKLLDALGVLVESPLVEQLEVLEICHEIFSGALGQKLLSSPFSQHAREICVRSTSQMSEEDVERLLSTPMPALRALRLPQSHSSHNVWRALAGSPNLATLETLHLHAPAASEQEHIDVLGETRNLRVLDISYPGNEHLTDEVFVRVFEAADMTHLESLRVVQGGLTGSGLGALAHAPRLRTLDLTGSMLGAAGTLESIAKHTSETLEALTLPGPYDDADAFLGGQVPAMLSRAWPRLVSLDLSQRGIEDVDLDALMRAGDQVPKLREVQMSYAHVTDACLQAQMGDASIIRPPSLEELSFTLAEAITFDVHYPWTQHFELG